MNSVQSEYIRRIAEYDSGIKHLKRISGGYVAGKVVSFLFLVYSIYTAYPEYNIYGIAISLSLFIIYVTLYKLDVHCMANISLLQRKRAVCVAEMSYLDGDFSCFRDGTDYIDIKHQFSYDLDIFGPDSLFHRINRTVTKKGEASLAGKLTSLEENSSEIERNSSAIYELSKLVDWRIEFMSQPFIDDNLKEVSGSLEAAKSKNFFIDSHFSYISVGFTLFALIGGIADLLPMRLFIMMFILQLILSVLLSRKVSHTNIHADKLKKEYRAYHSILKKLYENEFTSDKINDIKHKLFNSESSSSVAFLELSRLLNMFDQRNSEFSYAILNGLFLYDILLMKRFNSWKGKYLSHMPVWVDSIAEVDALVSLATYTYNNPDNVQAHIVETDNIIECGGLYHPFLWRKNPVANDFTLRRDNVAIITGANMAGKSTFLRSVGVNYILACCGASVAATSFNFSVVSLFSSMRTTDNLSKDISYFNAELIRLEQLIEHVKGHRYTLVILDEILKGTNSKDKLEGSVMFLNEVSRYNIAGIIATHDLELSKLEQSRPERFLNYCFEIELSDDIKYSYKIARGVSHNMNATYLLKNILRRLS